MNGRTPTGDRTYELEYAAIAELVHVHGTSIDITALAVLDTAARDGLTKEAKGGEDESTQVV